MSRTTMAQRKAEAKNIIWLLNKLRPEVEEHTIYKIGTRCLVPVGFHTIAMWWIAVIWGVIVLALTLAVLDFLSTDTLDLVFIFCAAMALILSYFIWRYLKSDKILCSYSKRGLQLLRGVLGEANTALDEFHAEQNELQPLLQKFKAWRPLVEESFGGKMIVYEFLGDFHVELYLTKFELVRQKPLRIEVTPVGYRQMVDLILARSDHYNGSLTGDKIEQIVAQLAEMEKEGQK